MHHHKEAFQKYATRHLGLSSTLLEDYTQEVNSMNHTVIEERPQPFREIDVFSRLIMDRIIFLGSPIDHQIANVITAQLLYLAHTNPTQTITLYINSPGGSVYDGLAIYDTMQYIQPTIATIGIGLVASMATVLLAAGARGKRAALPHARIMTHQPHGATRGQTSDMEITLKQFQGLREDIYNILTYHTGKQVEDIAKDADRDYWMRAEEAKAYGIIDTVLSPHN